LPPWTASPPVRKTGLVVDGDDLLAGADRKERLGGRGRERDDPVRRLRRRRMGRVGARADKSCEGGDDRDDHETV
jgi:hypothetical protein